MNFSNITTPGDYIETAVLAREAAKELLDRLLIMKLQPKHIVDIGCGIGAEFKELAWRYPQAQIYGLDLALPFLQHGKQMQENAGIHWIAGDTHSLPLRSHSVDLIFANLVLPWTKDYTAVLREWRRILRPNGLLLFSCLGPDTFKECKAQEHVGFLPDRVDMHITGDALMTEGFIDPVLEVEAVTLTYRDQAQLWLELEKSGMRMKGAEKTDLPRCDGLFPLSYEVVYGHAFCPPEKAFKADEYGVVKIPVSELRKASSSM